MNLEVNNIDKCIGQLDIYLALTIDKSRNDKWDCFYL